MGNQDGNEMGIIYPKGTFRGIYYSEELKLALKQGYKILDVLSAYEYTQSDILFKDYVDDLYEKRRKADKPILKDVYKKILNTLYGRFGLVYEKIDCHPNDNNDINNDEYVDDATDEFIKKTAKTYYNNIGIASAITSYARIYMYEIITKNNLEIKYIDTDGIFVTKPMPINLVTTINELGKFRLEAENNKAIFIANKFYAYQETNNKYTYKFKGIHTQFPILNIKEIMETSKNIMEKTQGSKLIMINMEIKTEKTTTKYTFQASRKRKQVIGY